MLGSPYLVESELGHVDCDKSPTLDTDPTHWRRSLSENSALLIPVISIWVTPGPSRDSIERVSEKDEEGYHQSVGRRR